MNTQVKQVSPGPSPIYALDFTEGLDSIDAKLRPESIGPNRQVRVNGHSGYHAQSLNSALKLRTAQHLQDHGSIVLWLAPLESLGGSPVLPSVAARDANWQRYGLMGDTLPLKETPNSIFTWYWQNRWHSQVIAKFKLGQAAGQAADYSVTPYVTIEHLPLHERQWYQLTLTWDKPASRMCLYVNGILCGTTIYKYKCETPRADLFLGNPAFVFGSVDVFDRELSSTEVKQLYEQSSYPKDAHVNEELRELFTVLDRPSFDWQPTTDWQLKDDRNFLSPNDLDGWTQQGCLENPYKLIKREITPEGLLLQTPDQIHIETRVYFWSPQIFEGDLAVELEFRPEQSTGLALLVFQATGIHREDFLTDHPKRTTGSMETIIGDRVKNYHWEFFRKAVDVRGDLGTQIIAKNPWERPLAMSTLPPFEIGTWHKLKFVQEGARIRCSMDGKLCFDVTDTPFSNTGPVFNSGRIGIRMMYGTRMRFKNLKVWNRSHFDAPA